MLMDLASVLSRVSGKGSSSKGSSPEIYLAVKISQDSFAATTWHVEEGKVVVGSLGMSEVKNDSPQSLLESADIAISKAFENQDDKLHKVIFGLYPDWISEGKIISEKLSFLRHLCKEINLAPLGFVPINEAIENFLKEVEGAPLTAVLVGIDKNNGWVTLYRAGKSQGTESISPEEMSSGDICGGIERALKKFSHIDVLPARMIIYNGFSDLESLEKKITAYPWTKQLPFLHFPKVEILPAQMVVKAVAIAGGTQMGGKIEDTEELVLESVPPAQKMEELISEVKQELEEVSAAQAGFVTDDKLGQLREFVVKQNPQIPPQKVQGQPKKLNMLLLKFKEITQTIKFNRPNLKGFPKLLPLVIGTIASGLAGFALLVYFVPKATVIIQVNSKSFDHEMEINASGQVVETTEIGTKKGATSGKKLVGDKAKGSVTIGNPAEARTFAAGTVLTSASGLKFVLTNDVQIASGSGIYALGTATASVTAAEIGDQYNLSAGTLFSIANFSGQAKNDSAFSGGNSHQATVVTKQDQDRLVATLSAELAAKAKDSLLSKLTSGQKLLLNAITSSVAKKKFSKDIDAEADTLSLDLTTDFKGVVASQSDIVNSFLNKFPSEVPSGYKIVDSQTNLEIKSTKVDKSGNVVMTASLKAKFLPEIDTAKVMREISGKSQSDTADYISKLTGVTGVQFEVKPTFFQPLMKLALPWRNNGVLLEIVSN